jgi:hypothetical protein
MNDFSDSIEIPPLHREPVEGIRISVKDEAKPRLRLEAPVMPDTLDLRVLSYSFSLEGEAHG